MERPHNPALEPLSDALKAFIRAPSKEGFILCGKLSAEAITDIDVTNAQ